MGIQGVWLLAHVEEHYEAANQQRLLLASRVR